MDNTQQIVLSYLQRLSESEPELILDYSTYSQNTKSLSLDRKKQLDELENTTKNCMKCNLASNRTKVVFGVGNPLAKMMFIGEGPGADEDRQGEPFVGKAGQLLNRIIAAMGHRREDVYIANIVKCRPPGNREPAPSEAFACLPYLKKQIEIIAPQVLIALGKVAAVYLLNLNPTIAVKDLRNRILNYNGIPLIVTYHPAALLRNPEYKGSTWADMQTALKLLSGELKWQSENAVSNLFVS